LSEKFLTSSLFGLRKASSVFFNIVLINLQVITNEMEQEITECAFCWGREKI